MKWQADRAGVTPEQHLASAHVEQAARSTDSAEARSIAEQVRKLR